MDFTIGDQPAEPVYVELFDAETPVTVANFLNYIENAVGDRRYDGTFIHRSVSNFVVQGGGFTFDPALGEFGTADSTPHIEQDPPIVNEFDPSRSNVRGTIAMAKIGNDPDSATSEWFFNLADNSANLDIQNGGFTVFGRVLGNGMNPIDDIAALPTENLGGTFSDLPLANHTPGEPVTNTNLVRLTRIEVVDTPLEATISVSPSDQLEFGDVGPGSEAQLTVSLANNGLEPLSIELVRFSGQGSENFSVTNNCTTLAFGETCTETATFSVTSPGPLDVRLEVQSNDVNQPLVTIPVLATASNDNDGIPDATESGAANNGDGNQDGILDSHQEYVASFPNEYGQYVTLETDPLFKLTNVVAEQTPAKEFLPTAGGGELQFVDGFYGFWVRDVPAGGSATVTLLLPPGHRATNFFKFGNVPGDIPIFTPPHWYLFDFDGETGAEIHGNRIVLHFVDGGRGDNDINPDGVIIDPGGPAVLNVDSGNSSSGGGGCSAYRSRSHSTFALDFVLLLAGLFGYRLVKRTRFFSG